MDGRRRKVYRLNVFLFLPRLEIDSSINRAIKRFHGIIAKRYLFGLQWR